MLLDAEPRIEMLSEKILVGKRKRISLADNQTKALWQSFMPRRNQIKNKTGSDLFSLEVYDKPQFFNAFNPTAEFEKWAAVEVTEVEQLPDEMETITIPNGIYAVFGYKGLAVEVAKTYQYIIGNWIPNSRFLLDNRPHFAVMGEKYKYEDPNSEEELWIPIKRKE